MVSNAQFIAEAKRHAAAAKAAGDYFDLLAKSGDLPITPEGFKQRVAEFFAKLDERQMAANALALAALQDQPCPILLFKPWCSYRKAREWADLNESPLPYQILNGKFCVRPSDFFAALKRHGGAE